MYLIRFWGGSVALRREESGFLTSGTPYVGSTSGNGSPGFLIFHQVNLDCRQSILDVLHHLQ